MSYQEQQKKVRAENVERERRKVEDELEQQNEVARKASEFNELLYPENEQYLDNVLFFENSNQKISYSNLSIEYEQNRKVKKKLNIEREIIQIKSYFFRNMN
jgi:hypothetical protein